jgi:hypothetical protein
LVNKEHEAARVAAIYSSLVGTRGSGRYAASFDSLASVSAHLFRIGDRQILNDDRWMKDDRVKLRFVREHARDYAEVVEGNSRATRRSTDFGALVAGASGRCGPGEVLVQQDRAGGVVAWTIPSVD